MTVVDVRFRRAAFNALLRDPAVTRDLERRARAIADACGGEAEGFYARTSEGATRSRAAVITGTGRAIRENASSNVILRNLDAGRR